MIIKTLSKYDKSRLNGSLIRDIAVCKDNSIIVTAENGEKQTYYIDNNINAVEVSADYLICELQNEVEIQVSKY